MTRLRFQVLSLLLVAALLVASAAPSRAQQPAAWTDVQVATLTDWPEPSLSGLLRDMGRRAPRLLPEIDSLALEYRYTADSTETRWQLGLSWRPGTRVLNEGNVLRLREGPSDIRMVSVEVLADVIVAGQKQAEMIVAVDSMALGPQPQQYRFDVRVGYDRVFLDTPPAAARRYLRQGVTLANLRIERMGFNAFGAPAQGQRREPDVQERRPAPRPAPSIYEPRVRLAIGWRLGPDPYYVYRGDDGRVVRRTERPREDVGRTPTRGEARDRGADRDESAEDPGSGEEATRGADRGDEGEEKGSGASNRSGRSADKSDDDDEDDDEDLLVPALAAAAGVGLAAYAGGTVGLFGTGDAPLGLTAGYTHPRGGVQVQAAINSAVIENEGQEELTVKALGFYDVFRARVQPALGVGAQIEATDDTEADPIVSVGLVGNLGRVVLYGGYDVVNQAPEAGIAYNFRYDRERHDSGRAP
jgi:hypothetical protein